MLQLKTMNREEMDVYLDAIKKGVLPHPAHPQNIKEIVNSFFESTINDNEFTLYCYRGNFESFKESIRSIRTDASQVNFAVLRFGEKTEHDILMLGYISEIVEFDNLIFSQYGGNDFFLEVLVPENHLQVIKSLDDLKAVWSEQISPYIKRIEEYALSYAINMVEIDKYDDNNMYLNVLTAEAFSILSEHWRKLLIEEGVEKFVGKKTVHFHLQKDEIRVIISEYEDKYIKPLKELLVELQEELVTIDHRRTLVVSRAYREQYYKYVLKTVRENNGVIYLAKKDSNVVGVVVGYIIPIDDEDKLLNRCPKRGRISELIVTKDARGYGIGKKLIKKMEAFFMQNDCEFSRLTVLENNQGAKQLYYDVGYQPVELELSKKLSRTK